MSKPNSGLFNHTTGAKNMQKYIMNHLTPHDIIIMRTKDLDLRKHPYNAKSNTSIRVIISKIASKSATKEEYKKYSQHIRLAKRRKEGVQKFWEDERERIIQKEPTTRNWSAEQIQAILSGRVPTYKGKSIQGHHTFSVRDYPHLANQSSVIFPVTFNEHFNGWHGGNFNKSLPGKPIKLIKDF